MDFNYENSYWLLVILYILSKVNFNICFSTKSLKNEKMVFLYFNSEFNNLYLLGMKNVMAKTCQNY